MRGPSIGSNVWACVVFEARAPTKETPKWDMHPYRVILDGRGDFDAGWIRWVIY